MAVSEVLAKADRAFVEESFDEAVQLYTEALGLSPNSATIYESRAQAQLKLENFVEAVEDASRAIELDPSLPKAYLRKGIASFKLEEYEAAKDSFEAGARLAPSGSLQQQFATWIRKCQAEMDEEGNDDAIATSGAPHSKEPSTSPISVLPPGQAAASTSAAAAAQSTSPIAPAAATAFAGKYRHQFYQMQNKAIVDVYAKNLTPEQVSVQFEPKRLLIQIKHTDGSEDYTLDVELYGEVVPAQSTFVVSKPKVEISMVKANAQNWATLEHSAAVAAPNYSTIEAPPVAGNYPSSAPYKKDWNKVESAVKEMEAKGELGEDPLNDFFKKIFRDGDEDQRRAMMKSFVESNGTVLSTNWQEVGAKKVECTPPDGMQVKKWAE